MKTFNLKLIAPDGVKYESEASSVFLPTPDGTIEILPDHMPLIATLQPGEMVIRNSQEEKHLSTEGGIIEVANNLVKILADTAEEASNLDELKIAQAKKNAEERICNAKDEVEFAEASALLEKQLAKMRFIKRRRHS